MLCYLCKEKKDVLTDLRKFKVRKSQIRNVSHLRKIANLTNYLTPQICGFAIWGNYLRFAHLCQQPFILYYYRTVLSVQACWKKVDNNVVDLADY
jgi:hypothetical protein